MICFAGMAADAMTSSRDEQVLVVLIGGGVAGHLSLDNTGQLQFSYTLEWQEDDGATPLSLSMPLARRSHPHEVVRPFLLGLLPDNERVVERWARDFQVSAANPFALLRHVGEDVAGAAQFVMPDRVDEVRSGAGKVVWLTNDDVGSWLKDLRRDPTRWHVQETGQFSLAGAQAKGALYYDAHSDRWGVPSGAIPTTHILKPAVTDFEGHDLNEHLCLETARLLGLPAARSQVASFSDERAIVVERYDREQASDGTFRRIHQEDVCQALGVLPSAKYQNDGGPGPTTIVELLRTEIHSTSDAALAVELFVDALGLNWVLAGTDAHAKNYSLLLWRRQVRMTPLYDVASSLAYPNMYIPKLKLAMAIGGEYRLGIIERRHWIRLAQDLDLDPNLVVSRVDRLAASIPEQLTTAASVEAVRSLPSDLPERLVDQVRQRAQDCRRALE